MTSDSEALAELRDRRDEEARKIKELTLLLEKADKEHAELLKKCKQKEFLLGSLQANSKQTRDTKRSGSVLVTSPRSRVKDDTTRTPIRSKDQISTPQLDQIKPPVKETPSRLRTESVMVVSEKKGFNSLRSQFENRGSLPIQMAPLKRKM
jgi:hypothetical protein